MEIISKPAKERGGPRAPWRTAFLPIGTIAKRDGVLWVLKHEDDSQGGYKWWDRLPDQIGEQP